MLGPDSTHFQVVAKTSYSDKREHLLGIERSRDSWKARRNGQDVKQLSDLAGYLPLVLIEPNSHLLVSGTPEGRRRFLDWGVFHVEQDFLLRWRKYTRALKQRNSALRKKSSSVVESLDQVMSGLGEEINTARTAQFSKLTEYFEGALETLCPELEKITLKFSKGWNDGSLLEALQQSSERDFERGATGPGPHKADIGIYIKQKPARDRVSRGEQKIISAALLLSQACLMSDSGETPLVLMDDLASEFDELHLSRALKFAQNLKAQIWISGTSYAPYSSLDHGLYDMFHVEQGIISKETST